MDIVPGWPDDPGPMRRWAAILLASSAALAAFPAELAAQEPGAGTLEGAEGAAESSAEAPPDAQGRSALDRTVALGLALVPGAVVHGSGHFYLGDSETGYRLLAGEGLGLGLTALGLTGLALTGASRKTIAPLAWLTMDGFGLFAMSWMSDIYGSVVAPDERGMPPLELSPLELSVGITAAYDPILPHRAFASMEAVGRVQSLWLSARGWFGLGEQSHRVRTVGAYRLLGARPGGHFASNGSHLDLRAGLTFHDYGDQGFDQYVADAALEWRLDLAAVSPGLRGTFMEFRWGLGLTAFDYRGSTIPTTTSEVLLGRYAWGFWLGDYIQAPWAEVLLFYNHRRDGLAGGMKLPSVAAGNAGSLGLEVESWLGRRWGGRVRLEYGSALLAGVELSHRFGGTW